MSYKSVLVDRIYLVRWEAPVLSDAEAVVEAVRGARQSLGQPIITIILIPEDSKPPGDDVRKYMVRKMPEMLDWCEVIHCVMEGSGFKNSLRRSVVTNIILLAGKRGRIFIHDSLDEALAAIQSPVKVSSMVVRLAARTNGLLSGERGRAERPVTTH